MPWGMRETGLVLIRSRTSIKVALPGIPRSKARPQFELICIPIPKSNIWALFPFEGTLSKNRWERCLPSLRASRY